MTDDARRRDDERALLIAMFRFGVIAPLVERTDFVPGERTQLVAQICKDTHYLPGSGPIPICARTVWAWLRDYRQGGIDELRPKVRKDRGTSRALPTAVVERAAALRRENPPRFTSTLIDILAREGTFPRDALHRATLDRQLARLGASRRQLRVLGERRTIKMRFERFGDLWVGDYHHGPVVLGPDGRPTTAKLGAFIDHTTRYPVADRYYLSEDLGTLRDTLLRAFFKWGLARVIYVDNGAVYKAEQLAYSLRRVQSALVHSRAYYSQGRGVIERWWQLATAFESEVAARDGLLTIHELNAMWEAWRELRYSAAVHSDLGITPNEAVKDVVPRTLDPEVARELFLVRAERKVHIKDSCISVEGRRFLCDSFLRGRKVQVRYDPNDLASVLIFADDQRVGRAFPQPINAKPEPHRDQPEQKPRSSVDYLALVREDYDRQLLAHARPLAYAQLALDAGFDRDAFAAVVLELGGLSLRAADRAELSRFWEAHGPLPEDLVRVAVAHAARLHGRGRHVRVYLNAVQSLVLAHWKNPRENS